MLIEGEEECGSLNLPAFVEANKAELKADAALVCDTGMWDRDTPAITSTLRGLVYEEVTIKAADRDLHSGVFGGGAANPIYVLTKILGGLKNEEGRILLPGFYDGVHEPPSQLKSDWAALNLKAEEFLGQIGLAVPVGEKGRMLIEMVQSRPTYDINGIWGGYEGEGSKTVIASQASAKVSFRLVGDQDPAKISAAFEKYVRDRLPSDCKAGVHPPHEFEGNLTSGRQPAPDAGPRSAAHRMGQGPGHHRQRWLRADRRGFQADARPRFAPRGLRPRR